MTVIQKFKIKKSQPTLHVSIFAHLSENTTFWGTTLDYKEILILKMCSGVERVHVYQCVNPQHQPHGHADSPHNCPE